MLQPLNATTVHMPKNKSLFCFHLEWERGESLEAESRAGLLNCIPHLPRGASWSPSPNDQTNYLGGKGKMRKRKTPRIPENLHSIDDEWKEKITSAS